MSRRTEEERVQGLLASLVESGVAPPPAEDAYWQARVRLVLEQERRQRAKASRPVRTLHVVMGVAALATAVVLLPFSPAIGLLAAPLTFAAIAVGARLLSEAVVA